MAEIKIITYRLIGLTLLIFSFCKNRQMLDHEITKGYKSIDITMTSPYSCYNELQYNESGSGKSEFGFVDSSPNKATVQSTNTFFIQTDSIRRKVSELVNNMRKNKQISSKTVDFWYHFVVEVDGEKYVDTYGEDSLTTRLLLLFSPYVQINKKTEQCNYFHFLKQIENHLKKEETFE